MVIPAFRGLPRTFGTYSGVRVSSEFVQGIVAQLGRKIGVVEARAQLRDAGFRFRDSMFDAVRREQNIIVSRGSRLDSLRLDARPGPNTLVQTNREFRRNFMFSANVEMLDPITGEITRLPVSFGDDRLLTRAELIERAESIAEQVASKGGVDYADRNPTVGQVRLGTAMARAPR